MRLRSLLGFQRQALQQEFLPGHAVNGLADRETQQLIARLLRQQLWDDPDNWLVEE